jgi:hypothetical protein
MSWRHSHQRERNSDCPVPAGNLHGWQFFGPTRILAWLQNLKRAAESTAVLACFPAIVICFQNKNCKILQFVLQNTNNCKIVGSHITENVTIYGILHLTYLLSYVLTPWIRVLLEKVTGLQLVKKFPAFYGTRMFITTFTSAWTFLYPEPAQSSPDPHINTISETQK